MHRILIVDDAPSVREALRWALEGERDLVVVGEADDGDAALALARELVPHLVILDVELPALGGFAVARHLKAMEQPPIVIFLTVHSDERSRQLGVEAGGDGFVDKGGGWPELIGQMRAAFARNAGSAGAS